MPVILAADTSTATNSVAICRDNSVLAESIVEGGRLHSERLIPTVDWLLGEAGITLTDVELLAISLGPGSFTGLRIGAATWKGLALANRLPLIGVPTLDAMTRLSTFSSDGYVATVLDARMKEVFAAVYRYEGGHRHSVVEACALAPANLIQTVEALPRFSARDMLFVGDGAVLYRDLFAAQWPEARFAEPALGVPRASAVAQEALALRASGVDEDGANLSPIYLRKSQAEVNREKKLASVAT
jgi:tRNA threonylcarbamoyladenosine biosynthesis protein TsaB